MEYPSGTILARRGLTLVELLAVLTIIGLLSGAMVPAVQYCRESARQSQCKNNLRQLGLASIQFHEAHNCYPPARLHARSYFSKHENCATTQPSWLARILPFTDAEASNSDWDYYAKFESHSDVVRESAPAFFSCPTRRSPAEAVMATGMYEKRMIFASGCTWTELVEVVGGAVGDYAGNHGDFTGGSHGTLNDFWRGGNGTGVIISSRPVCEDRAPVGWSDQIAAKNLVDGLSKTLLAGEMHVPMERLGQPPENAPIYNGYDFPASVRIGGPGVALARGVDDIVVPPIGFGSWHPGYCPFVAADGSVRLLDNFVDPLVLRAYCHREDGASATVDVPDL